MKKVFKKIKSIVQGWRNYFVNIVSDLKYRDIFIERLDVCENCASRKGHFCGECGCFIPAKTKAEDECCPLGKWNAISNE